MFKLIILGGCIYFLLKINTIKKMLSSNPKQDNSKINKNDPEEGEYIDYEEVD